MESSIVKSATTERTILVYRYSLHNREAKYGIDQEVGRSSKSRWVPKRKWALDGIHEAIYELLSFNFGELGCVGRQRQDCKELNCF
jgi:hypothetical protein